MNDIIETYVENIIYYAFNYIVFFLLIFIWIICCYDLILDMVLEFY